MSPGAEFDVIRHAVAECFGVVLEPEQEYLVASRLVHQLPFWGLSGLGEMTARLHLEPKGDLAHKVAEALVPNETFFFRDPGLYRALETQVIPALMERNKMSRAISIWSAACSSGQEPYSLALMILKKFPQLAEWNLRFVASDISRAMVSRTHEGLYSLLEVNRGLPAQYLGEYFERENLGWRIALKARRMLEVRELDLRSSWNWGGHFDLILARNVLIYFDRQTKQEILVRLRRQIAKGGWLFLGSSETTLFLDAGYDQKALNGAVAYQPKG